MAKGKGKRKNKKHRGAKQRGKRRAIASINPKSYHAIYHHASRPTATLPNSWTYSRPAGKTITQLRMNPMSGAGFFGDVWEGFKKPFKVINDIGKPFRGIAGQVFNNLPGIKQLGIDVTPYVGAASDAILGDGIGRRRSRRKSKK